MTEPERAAGDLVPFSTVYAELWDGFGPDYHANCLSWQHAPAPLLPPTGDGWQSVWTANPDFLELRGRRLLYYRASGVAMGREGNHDRIGVSEVVSFTHDRLVVDPLHEGQPILDVGQPGSFDGEDILDPAAVEFGGRVFLYYSAIGDGPDQVGLGVSDDGIHFTKVGPVMVGRAPDVVPFGGGLRMVYQRPDPAGNYQAYLAESGDGVSFRDVIDEPVFPRTPGSWDSLSIATVRLAVEGDMVYALYGGSSYLADEPDFFGLARSPDMLQWEFHPGNPIFGCGAKGAPDGGAIWFPALYEADEAFRILYEGSPGKYGWDLHSAICGASLSKGEWGKIAHVGTQFPRA